MDTPTILNALNELEPDELCALLYEATKFRNDVTVPNMTSFAQQQCIRTISAIAIVLEITQVHYN